MNAIANRNASPSFDPTRVPIFVPNQVLKDTDLNGIVTYLDSHNRLTRAHLIGMGIVCGLEVQLLKTSEISEILLTPGCGITSEGFFVQYLPATGEDANDINRFTHYREEPIPKTRLIAIDSPDEKFQLKELISAAEAKQPNDKNIPLTTIDLNQQVVLILCDWDDVGRNSCLVDCDGRGSDRNFRLRFFLIDKSNSNPEILNATRLLQTGFAVDPGTSLVSAFQGWFEVPDCHIDRLGYTNSVDRLTSVKNFNDLMRAYYRVCKSGILSIDTALTQTHKLFSPFISTFHPDPTALSNIQQRLKEILIALVPADIANDDPFPGDPPPSVPNQPQVSYGIQYFYDYLVELIAAFDELKAALFDLMDECPPNRQWFPKYLLAGVVVSAIDPCPPPDIYRHSFYQPPIYNGNQQRRQEVRHLYERLVQMSTKFTLLPFYQTPVKITPSRTRQVRLGEQAIPYYYSYPDIYPYWNYDACRKQRADRLPAYFRRNGLPNERGYDLIPRIDWADFFRVEGHLGLPLTKARELIEQYKNDFNLAFDVVVVQVGTGVEDLDSLQGYFDDLEVEFDQIKSDWQQKYDRAKATIQDTDTLNILDKFDLYFFRHPDLTNIDPGLMKNDFLEEAKNPINYGFRAIGGAENAFQLVLNIQKKQPFRTAIVTEQGIGIQIDRTKRFIFADATHGEQNQTHIREIFANDFALDSSILQVESDSNGILRFVIIDGRENIELVGTDDDLTALLIRLEDETPYNADTLIERYHDFNALFTFLQHFGQGSESLTSGAAAILVSYYEFRALFHRYLLRLASVKKMQLLPEYAQYHQGLEHLGGVPNGGTLVLVYTSESTVIESLIASDSALIGSSDRQANIMLQAQTQFPPNRLSDQNRLTAITSDRIGHNVVIADFCLPYLCCSAYSNLNYVVAKSKPFIGLPKPVYCEGDTKIYDFTLEPPGGLLKGGDGIIDHNGNYAFQPSTVDADVTEPMNLTFFYIVDGVGSSYSILLLPHVEIQFSIDPPDNPICVSPDKPKLINLITTPPGGQFQLSINNNPFQNITVNKNNQFDLSSLFSANDTKEIDLRFTYKVPNTDDYCGGTSEPLALTAIRQPLAKINYPQDTDGQAKGTLVYDSTCSNLSLQVNFSNKGSKAENYQWQLNGNLVSSDRNAKIDISYTVGRSANIILITSNQDTDVKSCLGRDSVEVKLPPLDPTWSFDNSDLPRRTDDNGDEIFVLRRSIDSSIKELLSVKQPGGVFSIQPKSLKILLADETLTCPERTQYILTVEGRRANKGIFTYVLPDGSELSRRIEIVNAPA